MGVAIHDDGGCTGHLFQPVTCRIDEDHAQIGIAHFRQKQWVEFAAHPDAHGRLPMGQKRADRLLPLRLWQGAGGQFGGPVRQRGDDVDRIAIL